MNNPIRNNSANYLNDSVDNSEQTNQTNRSEHSESSSEVSNVRAVNPPARARPLPQAQMSLNTLMRDVLRSQDWSGGFSGNRPLTRASVNRLTNDNSSLEDATLMLAPAFDEGSDTSYASSFTAGRLLESLGIAQQLTGGASPFVQESENAFNEGQVVGVIILRRSFDEASNPGVSLGDMSRLPEVNTQSWHDLPAYENGAEFLRQHADDECSITMRTLGDLAASSDSYPVVVDHGSDAANIFDYAALTRWQAQTPSLVGYGLVECPLTRAWIYMGHPSNIDLVKNVLDRNVFQAYRLDI